DPLRDEEVLAAIVPRAGVDEAALAVALIDHCAGRLAYYKLPGYVAFLDQLPTTSTQKLRRADLGPLAEAPMSHPRSHDLRDQKQALRKKAT
ncbi:MAG: ATP-dependent acyl-CoA ligase, partial [Gemmobacter sp.]|nr:ATP-dependent acyl-CoA ligase [Gemmobacter sp.]